MRCLHACVCFCVLYIVHWGVLYVVLLVVCFLGCTSCCCCACLLRHASTAVMVGGAVLCGAMHCSTIISHHTDHVLVYHHQITPHTTRSTTKHHAYMYSCPAVQMERTPSIPIESQCVAIILASTGCTGLACALFHACSLPWWS